MVPLLVSEPSTDKMIGLYKKEEVVAWWGTEVECASAIARLERTEQLEARDATVAFRRLADLATGWHLVEPLTAVKEAAKRLLRTHDLRAADSLQLSAALVVAEQRPATLEFVCRDQQLSIAAEREGLVVL